MTFTGAGVVTFLFTDLVGSTALIDRLGDDAADSVRRDHFDVLRKAVVEAGGEEVKNLGDGLMVSFTSPVAALSCAVAMQRSMAEGELRIRVGVHAGEPVQEGEDYFGTPVVIAKRLCDRADGGQILATELLAGLVGTRGGFHFLPRGRLALKGLSEPVATVEVRWRADEAGEERTAPVGRRRSARAARPRGPGIVGRERELSVLDDELAGAAEGELRCVLLTAEAGVGKTRLFREFLSRHDEVTPLMARAHPMGDTTAFGLWAEALDGHLRHLPAQEVTRCCGGFVEDLAAILRSVAAVRGSLPTAPPPRSSLLEGITVVLDNLSADSPVVVVLDDIHQADASSLDALSYLAANLGDAPVLVVLAARPAELAGHPLANRVLLPLEQDGVLTRLPLVPLDAEEIRALAASVLQATPPPALVPWLLARSQGNPLFALGLLRALLDEGADLSAPRLRQLPEDLAERVRALLATLEPGALTVLELLAVLGRPASTVELGSLSTKSAEDLSLSLDELIRHRTVTEEERGGEPAFAVAHPLVQETIYASIGTPRRRLLHREIGRALLAAGRPAEAAPHFTRSASRGDAEAIEALRQALREAEDRRAYREALSMLAGLVEILPEGDERWLEIGEVLSGEAEWAQFPSPSRSDGELAIRALWAMDAVLARSGEARRRGMVQLRLSFLLCWAIGDPVGAEQAAMEAVRIFEAVGDEAKVLEARHEAAWARGHGGDMHAQAVEAAAIVEEASRLGEEFLVTLALSAEANALGHEGHLIQAEARIRRAIDLRASRSRSTTQSRGVLAYWLAAQGRVVEATQELEGARAADPGFAHTSLLEVGTVVWGLAGDVQRALDWAAETIAWNPGELTVQKALGIPCAALMAAEAGDLSLARRYAEVALSACAGDWHQVTAAAEAVLGRLDVVAGGGDEALASLETAVRRLMSGARGFAPLYATDLAEFAGLAGDSARAEAAVAALATIAAVTTCTMHRGMEMLASAWAGLARSGFDTPDLAREAISVFDGLELPLLQGRAYDVLGRALAGEDRAGSAAAFQEAVARFESCGAGWRRDRALAELDRILGTGTSG
jgi:class 3 adenylate cyclase/tetratricopeptide (TPR) repeat protein